MRPRRGRVGGRFAAAASAAAATAGVAAAVDLPFTESHPDVMPLDARNYAREVVHSTQLWVVQFYTPTGQPSKDFAEKYEKAAQQLKGLVRFGAVNIAEEAGKQLAEPYGIQEQWAPVTVCFPTELQEVEQEMEDGQKHKGLVKQPVPYQGKKEVDKLVKWATGLLPDKQVWRIDGIDAHEDFLDAFKTEDMQHIFLFTEKEKVPPMYRALSLDLRYRMLFSIVTGDADWREFVQDKYGVKERPALVARPPFDRDGQSGGEVKLYGGEMKKDALLKWLEPMALPEGDVPVNMQKEMMMAGKRAKQKKENAMRSKVKDLEQARDLEQVRDLCVSKPRLTCAVAHLDGSEKWLGAKLTTLRNVVDNLAKKGRVDFQFIWIDAAQSTAMHDFFRVGDSGGVPSVTFFKQYKDDWRYQNLRGSFNEKGIQTFVMQTVTKGGGKAFSPADLPDFSTEAVEPVEVAEDEE